MLATSTVEDRHPPPCGHLGFPVNADRLVDDTYNQASAALKFTINRSGPPASTLQSPPEDQGVMRTQVRHASWCPTRDLLALIVLSTSGSEVQLWRLNGLRVWSVALEFCYHGDSAVKPEAPALSSAEVSVNSTIPQASALCWRPDGKVLAVGTSTGHLALVDVENGTELVSTHLDQFPWISNQPPPPDDPRAQEIIRMEWYSSSCSTSESSTSTGMDPARLLDELPRMSAPTDARPGSFNSGQWIDQDNSQVQSVWEGSLAALDHNQGLHLLTLVTANHTLALSAYGRFPLGRFTLLKEFRHGTLPPWSAPLPLPTVTCAPRLSHAVCAWVTPVESNQPSPSPKQDPSTILTMTTIDLGLLHRAPSQVHYIASRSICVQLAELLTGLVSTMDEAYATHLQGLHQKRLEILEQALANQGTEATPQTELILLLATGVASPGLAHFLQSDLQSTGLRRWAKSLENGYMGIRTTLLTRFKPTCERLLVLLTELLGQCQMALDGQGMGLDKSTVELAILQVGWLVGRVEEMLAFIEAEWHRAKLFLEWLSGVLGFITDTDTPEDGQARKRLPLVNPDMMLEYFTNTLFNLQHENVLTRWFYTPRPTDANPPTGNPYQDSTTTYCRRLQTSSPGVAFSTYLSTRDTTCRPLPFVFARPTLPYVDTLRSPGIGQRQILDDDDDDNGPCPGVHDMVGILRNTLTQLFAQPARILAESVKVKHCIRASLPNAEVTPLQSVERSSEADVWILSARAQGQNASNGEESPVSPTTHRFVIGRRQPSITGESGATEPSTCVLELRVSSSDFPVLSCSWLPTTTTLSPRHQHPKVVKWSANDVVAYDDQGLLLLARAQSAQSLVRKQRTLLLHVPLDADLLPFHNVTVDFSHEEPLSADTSDERHDRPTLLEASLLECRASANPASSTLPLSKYRQLKRTMLGFIVANGRTQRETVCIVSRSGRQVCLAEVAEVESSDEENLDEEMDEDR
ncbi:hypothetical protein IWQ62_001763 [Dispira parvispora]|uniref:Anaphase-promoting complex subunit 4 n=1 Tax=Dispira parvispora TaxID=1520584 RepID=A0A9W8ARU0_9FUNG|nr:hypothetical protein IWQ62_001763 [Dispira parvispora]